MVGLYQQRSTDSAPDDVQLKTAASKRDGASIRKLELGDALDGTRWRLIPHFFDTVFEAQGDQAKAIDTEENSGCITGIRAVLTMAGQAASDAKVFPLQSFLNAWVPEEETDAAPAPAETVEAEEVDSDVDEPDGIEQLAQFPKILAALRGAELVTLQEEECNRDVLVPWVAASLGVPSAGSSVGILSRGLR